MEFEVDLKLFELEVDVDSLGAMLFVLRQDSLRTQSGLSSCCGRGSRDTKWDEPYQTKPNQPHIKHNETEKARGGRACVNMLVFSAHFIMGHQGWRSSMIMI